MIRAGSALASRDVATAVDALKEAVALDPQLVRAWDLLGRVYLAIGKRELARQAFQNARKNLR